MIGAAVQSMNFEGIDGRLYCRMVVPGLDKLIRRLELLFFSREFPFFGKHDIREQVSQGFADYRENKSPDQNYIGLIQETWLGIFQP